MHAMRRRCACCQYDRLVLPRPAAAAVAAVERCGGGAGSPPPPPRALWPLYKRGERAPEVFIRPASLTDTTLAPPHRRNTLRRRHATNDDDAHQHYRRQGLHHQSRVRLMPREYATLTVSRLMTLFRISRYSCFVNAPLSRHIRVVRASDLFLTA